MYLKVPLTWDCQKSVKNNDQELNRTKKKQQSGESAIENDRLFTDCLLVE